MTLNLGFVNEETWIFLQNIYDNMAQSYSTKVFERPQWRLPLGRHKLAHRQLRHKLKDFIDSSDVVFFEWASALLKEASLLHTPKAGKLVTRLHRYELFQWAEAINWDAVSVTILDTEAMRHKLLARTSLSHEQTAVVPPVAIEPSRIVQAQRPFAGNIGILCNMMPRKRVYELILAFYALTQQVDGLMLHLGGPIRPNYRAYYEAMHYLIDQLNLADQVVWHGRVADRWQWYQQIDIFVSYSYSEGMQVAPLEAAASGCFCVSHGWEGADEIFSSAQLFMTEAQFVEQVGSYIAAADGQRQQLRAPLQQFVQTQCDFDRITKQLRGIIEQVAT